MQPLDRKIEGLHQIRAGESVEALLSDEEVVAGAIQRLEIVSRVAAGLDAFAQRRLPGRDVAEWPLRLGSEQGVVRGTEEHQQRGGGGRVGGRGGWRRWQAAQLLPHARRGMRSFASTESVTRPAGPEQPEVGAARRLHYSLTPERAKGGAQIGPAQAPGIEDVRLEALD